MESAYELESRPSSAYTLQNPPRTASPSPDRQSLAPVGAKQLAPVEGREAWTYLAAATIQETIIWGLPYSVGILHSYWTSELFAGVEGAETTLTLAATLQSGLLYISALVFSPLIARFPRYRVHLSIFGFFVASCGLVGSAFATKPMHLVICFGCLYPFACLPYVGSACLIFEWFSDRSGLASGILYTGTGVGGTVFPFIMQGLLSRFGYKKSMISLGLGFFIIGLVSSFGVKARLPSARNNASSMHRRTRHDWTFLRKSPFWAFLACIFAISLGAFVPSVWIPTYAQDVGSKPGGTSLIAIMNAASIPGLLLMGWISDRLPLRLVLTVSTLGSAVSLFLFWGLGNSNAMLVVFVVSFGLLSMSFVTLWTPIIKVVSKDDPRLPSLVFSIFMFFKGVGSISSGPVASALLTSDILRGSTGAYGVKNYGVLIVYSGAAMVLGAIAGVSYRT